ncbi:MAG: hypothetical protein ACJ797_12385 [Ktedonobacteraceae bacterium]
MLETLPEGQVADFAAASACIDCAPGYLNPFHVLDADFAAAGGKVRIQHKNLRELPQAVRGHLVNDLVDASTLHGNVTYKRTS